MKTKQYIIEYNGKPTGHEFDTLTEAEAHIQKLEDNGWFSFNIVRVSPYKMIKASKVNFSNN